MDSGGGIWGGMGGVGSVFFVDSNKGADVNKGGTWDSAFATLDYAIGRCTADKGDVIFLAPYHNENLVASATRFIDVDCNGVSIIGMGRGAQRPRFDFDTATSVIVVGADGVRLSNLTFRPGYPDVVNCIDIETGSTDFMMDHCEILDGEAGNGDDEFIDAWEFAAGCTNARVLNCKARTHASAGAAQSVVLFEGASDAVEVSGCDFEGPYGTACIENPTAALTRASFKKNLLIPTSGQPGIELYTGATGICQDNTIVTDITTIVYAIAVTGGAGAAATMTYFDNWYVEVVGETGALIGTASIDD